MSDLREAIADTLEPEALNRVGQWVHEASIWQPHADPKGRYQPIRDYAQAKQ